MKTNTLLIATTAASLGWAGILTCFFHQGTGPQRLEPAAPVPVRPLHPPPRAAEPPAVIPRFFTNTVNVDWGQVESEDYRKYIANLRAIGCPEETIRDLIVADVNKLFEPREKALAAPVEQFEFWKRERARAAGEDLVRQRIALAKEKRALLKDLLGVEGEDKTPLVSSSNRREQRLSFLAPEKQQQVAELEAVQKAKVEVLTAGKFRLDKADTDHLRRLETEQRAALARVLTPRELEDYDLRTSRTAQFMRLGLGDFEMTEEEFRKVFKLRKSFDDAYAYTASEDPRRVLAELDLEKQVRLAMGEERYAKYNQERLWTTSSLQNVAKEHGVPKEIALKVFDLKPVAEEQAARIRLDPSLDDDQRRQALKTVEDQTLKAVGDLLGPEVAQTYYREGAWLRNLSRERRTSR